MDPSNAPFPKDDVSPLSGVALPPRALAEPLGKTTPAINYGQFSRSGVYMDPSLSLSATLNPSATSAETGASGTLTQHSVHPTGFTHAHGPEFDYMADFDQNDGNHQPGISQHPRQSRRLPMSSSAVRLEPCSRSPISPLGSRKASHHSTPLPGNHPGNSGDYYQPSTGPAAALPAPMLFDHSSGGWHYPQGSPQSPTEPSSRGFSLAGHSPASVPMVQEPARHSWISGQHPALGLLRADSQTQSSVRTHSQTLIAGSRTLPPDLRHLGE